MFEDNVNENPHTGPLVKAMQKNGIVKVSVDVNLTSFEQQLILTTMPSIIEKIGVNNVAAIILSRDGTATVIVDNEPTPTTQGLMEPLITKMLTREE